MKLNFLGLPKNATPFYAFNKFTLLSNMIFIIIRPHTRNDHKLGFIKESRYTFKISIKPRVLLVQCWIFFIKNSIKK